jgi:hypothetical protein
MAKELLIPPEAAKNDKAVEVLRVWGANKAQHISINPDLYPDPAIYGIMLADLAGHVANAYRQASKMDRVRTLVTIRAGFEVALESDSDGD